MSFAPGIRSHLNIGPSFREARAGLSVTRVTLTPVSVVANTTASQNFNIPGLLMGDYVDISPPGLTAGVAGADCIVSAPGVLTVVFSNSTAGALTPPAGIYTLLTVR